MMVDLFPLIGMLFSLILGVVMLHGGISIVDKEPPVGSPIGGTVCAIFGLMMLAAAVILGIDALGYKIVKDVPSAVEISSE